MFIVRNGSTAVFDANDINTNWTIGSGVTLRIESGGTIQYRHNQENTITINGTIEFLGASATQLTVATIGADNQTNHTFTLDSVATLRTANANGIHGVANASIVTNAKRLAVTLNTAANYEFNGAAQTLNALPTTVNSLTLSGSGTKTFATTLSTLTGNLVLSGTASATAPGNLTVGGSFTAETGTIWNASSHTMNLAGHFTNSGTITAGTGTVVLNGTTARQDISGSNTAFNNLTINNPTYGTRGGYRFHGERGAEPGQCQPGSNKWDAGYGCCLR